jgi:hypothetical protein
LELSRNLAKRKVIKEVPVKANQERSLFCMASFFFSPIISRLWAVNVGSGRTNRRIKGRTKAKVVADGLVALNMMADAQARSCISRLRHCGLISLRHTHIGNDVLSRKTRYALRRLAPIGFARLLGAILGVTALAAAPVRAQDVNIDPTTTPPRWSSKHSAWFSCHGQLD